MSAVNNVTLIGNVGNDVSEDIKEFGDKKKVQVRLAVRRTYKNATGEYDTDWVSVNFWNRKAENAVELIQKGTRIAVTGEIRTEKYEKDGKTNTAFFIEGDHFQLLGSKKQEGGDAPF